MTRQVRSGCASGVSGKDPRLGGIFACSLVKLSRARIAEGGWEIVQRKRAGAAQNYTQDMYLRRSVTHIWAVVDGRGAWLYVVRLNGTRKSAIFRDISKVKQAKNSYFLLCS